MPADGDYETKRTTFGGCEEDCGTLEIVLGEQEAVVLDVKPWDLHGVGYVDVTVTFPDRGVETARLGPESISGDLQPGERVLVSRAMHMIVAVRRLEE